MEMATMGKVLVEAKIENLSDLMKLREGVFSAEQVRTAEVTNALVDTRATMLSLPKKLVEALGLRRQRTRSARTAAGVLSFGIYEPVRLTIQGRDCVIEVAEVPDECSALVGQVPLELLDFVVDPMRQALVGNPEHGGEHMMDLY